MCRKYLLLFLLIAWGSASFAQPAILQVDSLQTNLPDSVNWNSSATFTVVVQQLDSLPYTGQAAVSIRRVGGSGTPVATTTLNQTAFTGSGTTDSFTIPISFSPAVFDTGFHTLRIDVDSSLTVQPGQSVLHQIYVIPPPHVIGLGQVANQPFPDTAVLGGTIPITFPVKNKGNTVINGAVWLIVGVIDSTFLGGIVRVDSIQMAASLNPGDSTSISFSIGVNGPDFLLGGNGVVVWPRAPDALPVDTFVGSVYVIEETGIRENWVGYEEFKLYPNPSEGWLNLRQGKLVATAERVRIFNPSGQLIGQFSDTHQFDISSLPPGIYMIQVSLKGNRQKGFKVQKL